MAAGDTQDEYRYCVECMVTGKDIPVRQLRETLSALGGSLVVGGTQAKIRVHIHANDAEAVFRTAGSFGVVTSQKADDMLRQQAAAHHARASHVAVVTDSAADLPESQLEKLGIHLIPVRVHFGNHSYLDKVTLSPAQFFHELATNPDHPKTSQPPPGDFRRMFEFLSSHYDAVVSVSVTSRVSGTYNAAATAAARIEGQRVTVLDSGNASLGQGLIAMRAAETARAGGDAEQVAAAARHAMLNTRTYALLTRLDYAVRGGRVPRAVKVVADVLRLGIILTNHPDGRVAPGGVIPGRFRLQERFARWVTRRMIPGEKYRVIVGHGDCETHGEALRAAVLQLRPDIEMLELTPLGTALGVHGGPGLLVVGVERCA